MKASDATEAAAAFSTFSSLGRVLIKRSKKS